ncbi:DNA-binding transcriptional regulator, LysR family [Cohnella sp. OV330]|uniref:LysR family transcriptional regulator n=1 Tax=Cohnella sp. OV330 TaxID=1855288 RepID=UPI0008E90BF7|nr:LysR family transcriptional regulator [Cohnella sp. OV330]SFB44985.1 DNA-binding transcriptional regulator, LysR family [Cohnella sp. OV330]
MEYIQLRYFAEVARLQSFSRAAEKLHIAQPSLSRAIKSLENELGVVLFDRTTRYLRLTDDGEIVLRHAAATLSMSKDLLATLNEGKQLQRGELLLGLPPVIGASFFAGIIAGFRSEYPGIQLRLVEEGGKIVEQLLSESKLDIGIVVLPVDEEEFESLTLTERRLFLVLQAGHPLAGSESVRLSDLREEPFIMFKKGFSLYDRVREACILEGFEPRIAYESSQWDFMAEMVGAGLGVALLPDTAARKIRSQAVSVIPVTVPAIRWDIAAIWPRGRYLSHAARGWIAFMRHWNKGMDLTQDSRSDKR